MSEDRKVIIHLLFAIYFAQIASVGVLNDSVAGYIFLCFSCGLVTGAFALYMGFIE